MLKYILIACSFSSALCFLVPSSRASSGHSHDYHSTNLVQADSSVGRRLSVQMFSSIDNDDQYDAFDAALAEINAEDEPVVKARPEKKTTTKLKIPMTAEEVREGMTFNDPYPTGEYKSPYDNPRIFDEEIIVVTERKKVDFFTMAEEIDDDPDYEKARQEAIDDFIEAEAGGPPPAAEEEEEEEKPKSKYRRKKEAEKEPPLAVWRNEETGAYVYQGDLERVPMIFKEGVRGAVVVLASNYSQTCMDEVKLLQNAIQDKFGERVHFHWEPIWWDWRDQEGVEGEQGRRHMMAWFEGLEAVQLYDRKTQGNANGSLSSERLQAILDEIEFLTCDDTWNDTYGDLYESTSYGYDSWA
mmetsp:Transcript_9630/g.15076  ORF Transcript_9630/g.15076 Transcript_9630/m.15076 type:complete len:356 (-) Transcript_9630:311-1378(-)